MNRGVLVGRLVASGNDGIVRTTVMDCCEILSAGVKSEISDMYNGVLTSSERAALVQLVNQVSMPVVLDLARFRLATFPLVVSSLSLAFFLLLIGQWPVRSSWWPASARRHAARG